MLELDSEVKSFEMSTSDLKTPKNVNEDLTQEIKALETALEEKAIEVDAANKNNFMMMT